MGRSGTGPDRESRQVELLVELSMSRPVPAQPHVGEVEQRVWHRNTHVSWRKRWLLLVPFSKINTTIYIYIF